MTPTPSEPRGALAPRPVAFDAVKATVALMPDGHPYDVRLASHTIAGMPVMPGRKEDVRLPAYVVDAATFDALRGGEARVAVTDEDWAWLERMGFVRFINEDDLDTWAFGLSLAGGTVTVNIEVWGPTTLLDAVRAARARLADMRADAAPTHHVSRATPCARCEGYAMGDDELRHLAAYRKLSDVARRAMDSYALVTLQEHALRSDRSLHPGASSDG